MLADTAGAQCGDLHQRASYPAFPLISSHVRAPQAVWNAPRRGSQDNSGFHSLGRPGGRSTSYTRGGAPCRADATRRIRSALTRACRCVLARRPGGSGGDHRASVPAAQHCHHPPAPSADPAGLHYGHGCRRAPRAQLANGRTSRRTAARVCGSSRGHASTMTARSGSARPVLGLFAYKSAALCPSPDGKLLSLQLLTGLRSGPVTPIQ